MNGPAPLRLLLGASLVVAGCDRPDDVGGPEELCAWVGDPGNCYRHFAVDVGSTCGAEGPGTAPTGTFLDGRLLDVCVLSEQNGAAYPGGQVVFDPPLDPRATTLDEVGLTMIDGEGATCGAARFKSEFDFSLTIAGATYEQIGVENRDVMDVHCANGETHYFDRQATSECRDLEPGIPRAQLEIDPATEGVPGSEGSPGAVRFRVFFPEAGGVSSYQVEYFDCVIPPGPDPCLDGKQSLNESDVDCGGPECAAPCEEGQGCSTDRDCGEPFVCSLVDGLPRCSE
jgi:hypothetical protein